MPQSNTYTVHTSRPELEQQKSLQKVCRTVNSEQNRMKVDRKQVDPDPVSEPESEASLSSTEENHGKTKIKQTKSQFSN